MTKADEPKIAALAERLVQGNRQQPSLDSGVKSNNTGQAQTLPADIRFLIEAAQVSAGDSAPDVLNGSAEVDATGDHVAAIRLCNAGLRMAPDPACEIALHHNRSQAIVRHFEFEGRNKTSHQLSHVIAREHLVRDWEAIIGLWVEKSPSFNENALDVWKPVFDHVYVNYMPISMGLMAALGPDGVAREYVEHVPRVWDIAWVPEGLLVNGRLYPEYSSKTATDFYDQMLSHTKQIVSKNADLQRVGTNNGIEKEITTNKPRAAKLQQLLAAHPEDFRIYSSGDAMNALNMEPPQEPFENSDPRLIDLIQNALAAGRQVAIVAAGATRILPMIAKPGTRLFDGPPGTKLPPYEASLVDGEAALLEGTQAKLAGDHERGKRLDKQALNAFEKAEKLRPNEASPKLGIAEASWRMWQECDPKSVLQKVKAAEQLLLQGLSEGKINKFDGKDKIHFSYAVCYLALRKRDEAKAHLRQVLDIYPDHPTAAGILKSVEEEDAKSSCFVATAVYGSPLAREVQVFRNFRDDVLLRSVPGKIVVDVYVALSPPFAKLIARSEFSKALVRIMVLAPMLGVIRSRRWRK